MAVEVFLFDNSTTATLQRTVLKNLWSAYRRLHAGLRRNGEMKIQIKGNSLRLRLSCFEVARFLAGDCPEETIYFTPEANTTFTYALQREPAVNLPTVRYRESTVAIPRTADQANASGPSDQVGLAESISLGQFGSLALLVEKDLTCLDRSEKDNRDTIATQSRAKDASLGGRTVIRGRLKGGLCILSL